MDQNATHQVSDMWDLTECKAGILSEFAPILES